MKAALIQSGLAASVLLSASGASFGATQQVNLTAGATTATLPDGTQVPMWGYTCTPSSASCNPLNPTAAAAGQWSPVVITVPAGQDLQINLTNNLSFALSGVSIPTSLTIVGQLGGGLGDATQRTTTASPVHAPVPVTWFIAGDTSGAVSTPPAQGPRVQSFGTEVNFGVTPTTGQCAAVGDPPTAPAGCAALTWTAPRPGTYLLESGTHPSIQGAMGLFGMVVVTTAPSTDTTTNPPTAVPGTAYPGVTYAAEIPLLFSEIDPVQNNAVQTAVITPGFQETSVRVERDSLSSVTLAVDANGNVINAGTGYAHGDPIAFSPAGACSPRMPTAIVDTTASGGAVSTIMITDSGAGCTQPLTATVNSQTGTGAQLTAALSLAGVICSDGAAACYPPAVNYTPLYYLINGRAFDRTNASASLFPTAPATGVTGNVLVRLVNAGLRMHVPAIVNATTGTAAAPGMSLIAEDGNLQPGVPRVQSEVFMAAGKTYDVMINPPPTTDASGNSIPPALLPIYDRQLSLSGNSINRDSGMLAYIGVNGASAAAAPAATANPDFYNAVIAGQTLTISDPSKGVIANDVNVFGVKVTTPPAQGTLTLNANGTFTYVANNTWVTPDSFTYCGNGATAGPACTMVTLGASNIASSDVITCAVPPTFNSTVATSLSIKPPGVLAGCQDGAGLPMVVAGATAVQPLSVNLTGPGSGTAEVDPNGGFTASVTMPGSYTLNFQPQNSLGSVVQPPSVNVILNFPVGSGLQVSVLDGADKTTAIRDYRWVIEEDLTFYVDPRCTQNPLPAGCPMTGASTAAGAVPLVFGTNFHTSHMPLVATGCTGPLSCESGQTLMGSPAVCDVGNGACRTTASQETALDPSQVQLDPTKRYYISVLPGDAANPFVGGNLSAPTNCAAGPYNPDQTLNTSCGHGLGGASIAAGQIAVTALTVPSPYPPAKLTVFVFEDDFPLNGEHDAGGAVDVLAANEPGLGGFEITLFDDAGGTGDATGQPTYDMFNQPLTNSLAGTVDPVTGLDACPISPVVTANVLKSGKVATADQCAADPTGKGCQKGIIGMILTCPKYESDGTTLSPLAGQAVVNNLYQGRYGVVATPGADRIARGEEWLQTNTLDGQKAHDSFMRIGEPAYFQEFGPAGYHVSIGFANPKIINDRKTNDAKAGLCDLAPPAGLQPCDNEVKGHVTMARMSRVPDERLYGSGTRDTYAFTQCYASLGDPEGADFAFTKCDADGNFDFTGIPAGNWKLTIFDQWNDQIVDGISQAVGLAGASSKTLDIGEIAAHQWQANIYTRTFFDQNGNGVSDKDGAGNDLETGLALVATNIRFRDGSFSNFNNTDLNGYAGFNEVFPLFNWYTIETDSTRYKTTGVHVVYDAGGPVDGSSPLDSTGTATPCAGSAVNPCGSSNIAQNYANTYEANPLPLDLRLPGAVYCAGADCIGKSIANGPGSSDSVTCTPNAVTGIGVNCTPFSSGRIDPPYWWGSYGWQGFSGQNSFLEFGKMPYAEGETGGIRGHVVYASTRPFDDPQLLLQLSWEPLVPHVRINLYQEGVAADGVTATLTLIDHTETTSFDDWAQGIRKDASGNLVHAADGVSYVPNISCPGQSSSDPFFFGLQNQPEYLDWYNSQHSSIPTATSPLAYNAQYKCYDGMHNWNQLQPAPYDGMYSFPSVTSLDPVTGKPIGTNCTACIPNPSSTNPTDPTYDPYRAGTPMLPAGKYVVEVVVPPGYELVKEEDKNILIGDNFIAPVTVQFPGLGGSIYILPDQAELSNAYNPQNPTQTLGRNSSLPSHEGDTGSVETFYPCVGAMRIVPDYISLFPQSAEVSPFAGATRPLCDRKEVNLTDQSAALAKFYIFTSTHVASHYTGVITDDFTAEFDPFSPQFGEKFAPAYLPVSVKDWTGNEISRVYADQFGAYNGLNYSTWEVDPPNPTGYGPTLMVTCMNDSGSGTTSPWWGAAGTPDPQFQSGYSQFCYELPFMPGQTGYFDTPVVPVAAFSEGYNHPDCDYPAATPAIASVVNRSSETDSAGTMLAAASGPWVSSDGHSLTINALPDQLVDNYGYSGPAMNTPPFNQQKVLRHFGFGLRCTSPTAGDASCNTLSSVTIGGRTAAISSWSDTQIVVTVPSQVPNCAVRQQAVYGGSPARCGELVITAGNGKTSVDTVTVTIGGKAPTVLKAGQTIQSAIDHANPGDMIIVPPGIYHEILLMWKPIRLQGVGAASSMVNADAHPAGKLDPWRQQVACLFGLTPDGRPNPSDTTCSSGWTEASGGPNFPTMIVDRLPAEGILGWDTTVNGNLAEQLIEPGLIGAYEGAAITVLGKGVNIPAGAPDAWGAGAEAQFPDGSVLLSASDCSVRGRNPYPSNFYCNPSSIDGLTLRNSSQGGGGVLVHAYAHNLQIANNRVYNNTGTLSGGITIGQGEHVDLPLGGASAVNNIPPGSCESSPITNLGLPFCYDVNVNVHHNSVTRNSNLGDELFSSTSAGAGGVTFSNGSDYYQFANNWICGNVSTGDGGGVSHIGWSKNGLITHNLILFNESTNPTITTNGGGVLVMGAPDPDPTCGAVNDQDCVPAPGEVPPSDGTGPDLKINANLILGNAADSGSGGGLRLQHVNGTDVINFPNGLQLCPDCWNEVKVRNNIIVNNVAGWDGAGVSLQDALKVDIVNNTIMSNDSTASAGTLFDSLFAPLASAPGTNCTQLNNPSQSCPQVAGVVSITNSAILQANLPVSFRCPSGHGVNSNTSSSCRYYSVPMLFNNVLWENRSFYIGVGAFGGGNQSQQKVVSLFDSFTTNQAASQAHTGDCFKPGDPSVTVPDSYWEIGVRGDTAPNQHSIASDGTTVLALSPSYSLLTDASDYPGANNVGPPLVPTTAQIVNTQYCNGSRSPPEAGIGGAWLVPPGTNETNALPTPIFSLTASATVDEGNNWINMRWGPLALTNPISGATLGDFSLPAGSPAIDQIPSGTQAYTLAPAVDFFGHDRKTAVTGNVDIGAVEFQGSRSADLAVTKIDDRGGSSVTSATGTVTRGQSITYTIVVTNNGPDAVTGATIADTLPGGARLGVNSWTCTPTAGSSCTATGTGNTSRAGTVSLLNGGQATYTLLGTVPNNAPLGVATNTVDVTAAGATDPSAANNTAIDRDNITPLQANVMVTKDDGLTNVLRGTTGVTYTVTVTNNGPSTITGGTITDTLPGGSRFGVTLWTCTAAAGSICTATGSGNTTRGGSVTLPSGGKATYTLKGNVPVGAPLGASPNSVTLTDAALTLSGTTSATDTDQIIRPTIASITPITGSRAASGQPPHVVPVTITGTDLGGANGVTISGNGVTCSSVTPANGGTTVTANCAISSGASLSARNVTVTTAANGTSNTLTGAFTVTL
jgi:uncharacterized repeat protein (TIGR01451 family)